LKSRSSWKVEIGGGYKEVPGSVVAYKEDNGSAGINALLKSLEHVGELFRIDWEEESPLAIVLIGSYENEEEESGVDGLDRCRSSGKGERNKEETSAQMIPDEAPIGSRPG
jgi:hypothetical protein